VTRAQQGLARHRKLARFQRPEPAAMQMIESILADAATITALRRDIHAHPELCFQEARTADLIAKALTDWGIPVHRGMGTTGVVGIVKNGTSIARWACAPTSTRCR
jgi:hypothetical protein